MARGSQLDRSGTGGARALPHAGGPSVACATILGLLRGVCGGGSRLRATRFHAGPLTWPVVLLFLH